MVFLTTKKYLKTREALMLNYGNVVVITMFIMYGVIE